MWWPKDSCGRNGVADAHNHKEDKLQKVTDEEADRIHDVIGKLSGRKTCRQKDAKATGKTVFLKRFGKSHLMWMAPHRTVCRPLSTNIALLVSIPELDATSQASYTEQSSKKALI